MSQQNTFNLLKKKKKWMTEREISKILGVSNSSTSLQKLYKYGEILRKKEKIKFRSSGGVAYLYKIK